MEPAYNSPVLSGHSLLSVQFSKSWIFTYTNTVIVTCIKQPPLFSGHGHPLAVPCLSFFVLFTWIKHPPLKPHVFSCSIFLCLLVFKEQSIITTEMTKLMLIINRWSWLILSKCQQWAVIQNHRMQKILFALNLLLSSSTWNFFFRYLVLEQCDWEGMAITSTIVNAFAPYRDFPVACWFEFYYQQCYLAKFPLYLHVDCKNYEMMEWDVCCCEL